MYQDEYILSVNTSNTCFFCVSPSKNKFSLKHFWNLFEINLNDTIKIPEKLKPILRKAEAKLCLCEECEELNEKATVLFRELEEIQLRISYFMEVINDTLEVGERQSKDGIYQRMEDAQAQLHSGIVEKLKKEIKAKCRRNRKEANPPEINQMVPDPEKEISDLIPVASPGLVLQEAKCNVKFEASDDMDLAYDLKEPMHSNSSSEIDFQADSDEDLSFEEAESSTSTELKGMERFSAKKGKDFEVCPVSGRYNCLRCGITVKNWGSFYSHFQHLHSEKYKCDLCSKLFARKHMLGQHRPKCLKFHLNPNPTNSRFVCDICGKGLCDKTNLDKHMKKIHFGDRTYPCKICGKVLKNNFSLKIHIQSIHQGIYFFCQFCTRKFPIESMLKRHEKACRYAQNAPCVDSQSSQLQSNSDRGSCSD